MLEARAAQNLTRNPTSWLPDPACTMSGQPIPTDETFKVESFEAELGSAKVCESALQQPPIRSLSPSCGECGKSGPDGDAETAADADHSDDPTPGERFEQVVGTLSEYFHCEFQNKVSLLTPHVLSHKRDICQTVH